jgi:arylsulfatase A-like enzyme/Tfp pilus assembly protein PilF
LTIKKLPVLLSLLILSEVPTAFQRNRHPEAGPQLNVLLLTIDTLRADRLSCYGSPFVKTPHIDILARKGMLFSRAFANTSTTLPSHANILLGVTPNYHGVHENLNFVVPEEMLTLAEHLKSYGYATGAFVGAYPLESRFGLAQGFDTYDDHFGRRHTDNFASLERKAEDVIEGALAWLQDRSSPWFLWVHCWDPHIPYDPPEPFKSQYKEHLYEGEVAYVDLALGRLFDQMKKAGLFDSTLIIFTGDHGESLGQHGEKTHGFFAYNSSLWIPLIVLHPSGDPGHNDQCVSHIDIFPTICDALGITQPPFLQGFSLLPALTGTKLPERPIYFESLYPYYSRGWAPLKGFIHLKRKFIDSPIPEFYDLGEDFDELRNLAEKEKSADLRIQLNKIIGELTPTQKIDAAQESDRETREKLASLGYISGVRLSTKKEFGIQDDVKILLPYINKAEKAWQLYQEGKREEAIALLNDIIKERENADLPYQILAFIYQAQGDTKEAIMTLEHGLAALPSNYEMFSEYVKLLISARQYDKVISRFEGMSLREMDYDPAIWNNLGIAHSKKGNFEQAIKAFEMGLSLDDKLPELNNNLANAYFTSGLKSRDRYLFSRCFEFYKRAIELDPGYSAAYRGLGHAYEQEGNIEDAVSCWEKAREADPSFLPALFDLATAYINAGDKTKALDMLRDYKARYYHLLAPGKRERLDSLIEKARN